MSTLALSSLTTEKRNLQYIKHGRIHDIKLKSEFRIALVKIMKINKVAGPNETAIKMLTSLDGFEIDKVTKVINENI